MQTLEKKIHAELLNFAELSLDEQELITTAVWVRKHAQAPHSNYRVGAAVRSESFRLYFGCNVENSNFTSTTHAEQVAITSMIAHEGPAKITAMAIVGARAGKEVKIVEVAPLDEGHTINDLCFACGHCLQIAWENCMADPNVVLLLLTSWGEVARTTIGDAYPMRFGPESLGIDVRKR